MRAKSVPVAIERLRHQFAAWRSGKRPGDRIPERLWDSACEVARSHGVYAVSQAASLDHASLRRRVGKETVHGGDGLTFLDLGEVPASSSGGGCLVELEKCNGTRLRICVRDGAVDWARVKEAFLGA